MIALCLETSSSARRLQFSLKTSVGVSQIDTLLHFIKHGTEEC